MAQTKIEIANDALLEIGFNTIEAFDESDDAIIVDRLYDLERDAMLLGNRWSWLRRRVELSPTALASPPGEPFTETSEDRAAMRPREQWTGESEQRRIRRGQDRNEFRIPSITSIVQAVFPDNTRGTPDVFGWRRSGEFVYASRDRLWADVIELSSEPTFHRLFVNALVLSVAARIAPALTEDPEISSEKRRLADLATRKAQLVDAQSQPAKRITSFPYVRARVGGDRVRYGIGSYPT